MKNKLYFLYLFVSISLFSQKKDVIYEIDGVEVDPVFFEELEDLNDSIVHHYNVVEDELKIDALGYYNTESVIQIYTNAYINRPDSLKQIPSTRVMDRIEGKWHLKDQPKTYTGAFRDYYLNGTLQGKGKLVEGKLEGKRWLYNKDGSISEELHYLNGFPEGKEVKYFPDGTIQQIGFYQEGYEVGEWKKFHTNGELKQVTEYAEEGKLNGEVRTYYSTGELKGVSEFVNGVLKEDRKTNSIMDSYDKGKKSFQLSNFEEAIKLFTKCIQLKLNWNDAYFARGTAYMNNFEFEKALADFNKAIEIEPLDAYAYSNRAFVLIREQEYINAKEISSTKGVAVFGNKKVEFSNEELERICQNLQKAKSLGDDSRMLIDALDTYCK
jgi:antitoxin component YwqK of YwqJK toxin-antitoxin module